MKTNVSISLKSIKADGFLADYQKLVRELRSRFQGLDVQYAVLHPKMEKGFTAVILPQKNGECQESGKPLDYGVISEMPQNIQFVF